MWQDVSVTQVIDGRHFWAHVGGEEVRTRITELSNQLLSQVGTCTCDQCNVYD